MEGANLLLTAMCWEVSVRYRFKHCLGKGGGELEPGSPTSWVGASHSALGVKKMHV